MGFLGVDLHAPVDDVFIIVSPLDKGNMTGVTQFVLLWLVRNEVVGSSTLTAISSVCESIDNIAL
jgi:hypothetical protein